MTAEQLQTVRAERWRHIANPLLTADDAHAWLDAAGLCLFLPRRQQFLAPAPSLVEACAGAPSETPSREAIDNAAGLMRRLVAERAVIPLNLFGTPSETPDFLATPEAFPHLFSLRGTRDWKTVPAGKTTPLVIEIWKQLEKEGALTAVEIQNALGRELTEAAVLRGLMELWGNLRAMPEYEGGAPTRWSLTQFRFKDALTAAGKLSQMAALSALVSLYLESVIAATSEEVETFLSPLTSRSRVRETVNGLAATRQLSMVPVGTQSMFHIAGTLPEFAEPEVVAPEAAEGSEAGRKPRQAARAPRSFDREGKPAERKPFERKPFERQPFERKTGERKAGERKSFGRKAFERGAAAPRQPEGERKPWPRKAEGEGGERKPFGERKAFGERKPFGKRPAFGKKPFDKTARPFRRDAGAGEAPAGGERAAGGERRSFRPAGAGRGGAGGKFPPKRFGFKPGGGKPEGRGDRPWTPRPASGSDSERRPAGSGDSARPFRPREGGVERRSGGFAGKARSFGAKKFEGADRPKFGGAKGGSKFGGPKSGGGTKFGGARSGGAKFGGKGKASDGEKRPFFRKRPEEGSGGESRPRSFARPKFGGDRPGGPGGRPGFSGGAGFSKPRPRPEAGFSKPSGDGSERTGAERPRPARPAFGKAGGFSKPPGKRAFGKSSFGEGKPAGSGSLGGRPGGGKSFGGKTGGAGKKFGGAGKKFGGAKKFGGPKKFGGAKKFGGPGNFAPRKPGGAKPPFRKRKDEGSKSAE